jgi:phosphate transport system substrate-binding protein
MGTANMLKKVSLIAISALALSACNDQASTGGAAGGSRQEIRIVGSSTVFPFAKAASEAFAKADPSRKSPVLESTGTGGGIEQFCKGVGADTPDIVNASRRMKKSEFDNCQKNGVKDIIEVQVGIDGLALAQSNKGVKFALSTADVYKALAANPFGKPQTAKLWSDVNPSLPKLPISVYGPPTTSGTRDSFHELIMESGCKTDAATKALKDSDEDKYKAICTEVRTDGAFKEQGENDNLIVQKLSSNPNMVGIFGYSYMEENASKVHGITMNGVNPTIATISDGSYPGARKMFIYVKKAHVDKIPGIKDFVLEFLKGGVVGGYLTKLGMIASSDADYKTASDVTNGLTAMTGADLK